MTSNGNSATITPTGSGDVQLVATVTACGQPPALIGTALRVGAPAPVASLTIDGVDPTSTIVCRQQEMALVAHPGVIEQDVTYEESTQ